MALSHRQAYIERYMKSYIEHWSVNVANQKGVKYVDRADSVTRVLARTLAETAWDMLETDVD